MIEQMTESAKPYSQFFEAACNEFGITNPLEKAHLAAQCAHESNGFKATVENLNYSAKGLFDTFPKYFTGISHAGEYERQPERIANKIYANRMGNRSEASGDGYKYRGRGLLQTTGYRNVRALSLGLFNDERLVKDPSWISTPEGACRSAAYYWKTNNLRPYAMADDLNAISGIINVGNPKGRAHGMPGRRLWLTKAKAAFGV